MIVKKNLHLFVDVIIVNNLIVLICFFFAYFYNLGRICGLLFCNRCCSYEPQAKLAGFNESNIRLCSYCSSTLLKLPNSISTSNPSSNSQHILSTSQIDSNPQQQQQQQLQNQQYSQDLMLADSTFNSDHFSLSKNSNDHLLLNVNNDQTTNSNEENLIDSDSNFKNSSQQQQSSSSSLSSQQRTNTNFNLKSLFNEIFRTSQGLQMQKQRQFFRTIECIPGKDIIDWLIKNQRASILSEAKLICQCFINESYLEPVILPPTSFIEFKPDQTLYRIGKVNLCLFCYT